jgi:hypothetical protein
MSQGLQQEWEVEGEFEGEFEEEMELEQELEHEIEGEVEGEEFLGTVARGLGSLLGEGEMEEEIEGEVEGELELETEGEYEGEEFFRRLRRVARGIGGFVRRAAPILRNVARVAAPIVGRAVGTALGGPAGTMIGGQLGGLAARALREGELELELEGEFETEVEGELETEAEGPVTPQQAAGELMAAVASRAQTEAEAEAMAGASAVAALSNADRAALRRVLPHLVRGVGILTRFLRRRRITRPVVRAVPAIMRRTAATLRRRVASGQPVTRRTAARVMASQTRRVIGSPRTCASALRRNVRAATVAGRRRVTR